MEDVASQISALAESATAGVGEAASFLYSFQSMFSMINYFATCVQLFSLSAYDLTTEFAFDLHGHRPLSMMSPGAAWSGVARNLPIFRLPKTKPLRHDELSSAAVADELRLRLEPGRRVLAAEIGVFRANLSAHVWRRLSRQRGSLELHLVDHWGDATASTGSKNPPVGTGSNMGGASNSSLLQSVVRTFVKEAASPFHVPYWDSEKAARDALASYQKAGAGDVFFHRTTSVGAAASFKDGAIDLVYVDADHKWWSVVQDIAAWWPKVRPGGIMMGHDFHLNTLMERDDDVGGGGNSNDVPLTVLAFFRWPLEIRLHSGFVWSVRKPIDADALSVAGGDIGGEVIDHKRLCALLRRKLAPHWDFEVCEKT
eukprot:TRINITY_DN64300_c0_g1_i2.p1 TRINITY_DN64300_c0_g1~~TRINITY_DN64300_c0_g1_i2.p1  ORF type:complete len:370 (-),score=68.63 TRINITY_DN64300_c0_g1_i2:75-1184(-)